MRLFRILGLLLVSGAMIGAANADTIRVAIGTQDTTINCATGGLLIRELKLLEKFLRTTGNTKTRLTTSSGRTSPAARR